MRVKIKGSSSSGWYAPGRGTHTGEKHRAVGSGKAAAGKKPVKVMAYKQRLSTRAAAVDSVRTDLRHDAGLTPSEVDAAVKAIEVQLKSELDGQPISVRVPERTAENILRDGRLKNQHESRTSGGAFNPDFRKDAETTAFVIEDESNPQSYPIYGYIPIGVDIGESVHHYGNVEIVLRQSMRSRTTVTVGDSLSGFANGILTGTPINDPKIEGMHADFTMDVWGEMGRGGYIADAATRFGVGYIEAQVHGGVAVSDIARVVVHNPVGYYGSLAVAVERAGLKLEYTGDLSGFQGDS